MEQWDKELLPAMTQSARSCPPWAAQEPPSKTASSGAGPQEEGWQALGPASLWLLVGEPFYFHGGGWGSAQVGFWGGQGLGCKALEPLSSRGAAGAWPHSQPGFNVY